MPRPHTFKLNGKRKVIRMVEEHTETTFFAQYKGYQIEIELNDRGRYSIDVRNPEVDGYAPSHIDTMDGAIKEAIRGAML